MLKRILKGTKNSVVVRARVISEAMFFLVLVFFWVHIFEIEVLKLLFRRPRFVLRHFVENTRFGYRSDSDLLVAKNDSQLLVAVFKNSLNTRGTFGAFGDILEKSGISASKVGTVLRFSGVSTSP